MKKSLVTFLSLSEVDVTFGHNFRAHIFYINEVVRVATVLRKKKIGIGMGVK
jgi:hypothetical protein